MTTETETSKLSTGQLIPNFLLSAVNRDGQVGPWDYKQHRNLVLIFFRTVECLKCTQLLRQISEHYHEYQQMEAEVLAISSDEIDRLRQLAQDLALPFPVLSDREGGVKDLYLEHIEQHGDRAAFEAAIFVARGVQSLAQESLKMIMICPRKPRFATGWNLSSYSARSVSPLSGNCENRNPLL